MTKALVLAGGGTRGSYQNGVLKALRKIGQDDFQMVTGTSIGALNAALVVQHDDAKMDHMWHTLNQDEIINGGIPVDMDLNEMINERTQILPFVKNFLSNKGADIWPLIHQIEVLYDQEKFFASDLDFGCVVCRHKTKEPVFVDKKMMEVDGVDWLISTASAYPAFPVHRFKGHEYIDGGYFDNLPVDLALQKGADEIIAVDLNNEPQHPNFMDREGITYIFPRVETGSFLVFDPETVARLEVLGYNDTMKAFHQLKGVKYTFAGETEVPSFMDHYYHEMLLLETRIKLATGINERFRSDEVITDRLKEKQHRRVIDKEQIFYGLMDELMDLSGCDVKKIWKYEEAKKEILSLFEPCRHEDYPYKPSMKPQQLLEYTKSLDEKGIISKMVHSNLYPDHAFFTENVRLTVYPFEKALALFVNCLMEE